jgi:glycolate oxidase iron-sulfur subunit
VRPPAALSGTPLGQALQDREELLSHCVHCGFCLPVCPTYQELGDEADSPRGRLHLMRAVVEGRIEAGDEAFQRHMDRCLGCRACETVCPSGVEYGLLLERARSVALEARPAPLGTRLLLATMASRPLGALFGLGGRLLRGTRIPALAARRTPEWRLLRGPRMALAMLAASAPVSLARMAPGRHPGGGAPAPVAPSPGSAGRAALLRGCVQNELFRRVHEATIRVLRAQGWTVVEVEGQGCCGALHAHAGDLSGARALATRNLEAFAPLLEGPDAVDVVVANAAGCGALLRELPELMEAPEGPLAERARRLAHRVRDISEVVAGQGVEPVQGAPLPLRVAYDPPCHLHHAQRVVEPPRRLLQAIPGLELVPLADADRCCGGAGIYGLTHPELGGEIGGGKVRAVAASGCQVLATGNPGCQMQIGAGLRMAGHPVEVVHPVELLAESYRRAGLGGA